MESKPREWTFLTNHGHVLLCVTKVPDSRLRDIAATVGITERAAQLILGNLIQAGYIERKKIGRRNTYTVNLSRSFRHPMLSSFEVNELVQPLVDPEPDGNLGTLLAFK